jgi:hypothetical protein
MSKTDWSKMTITCKHVTSGKAAPEYSKKDDSYICSKCRDKLATSGGFDKVKKDSILMHKDCLLQQLAKQKLKKVM